MSLYRLVGCRRLGALPSSTARTVRWQSSDAARKGGGLRKVVISLAVTGTAVGGVLAYSNYNPVFKNQVNERVPGFASLSDKTADIWVDIKDYFNPKPATSKKNDAFVIEHNQAKVKARLDELKKSTPAKSTAPVAPSTNTDSAATDQKKAKGGKEGERSADDETETKLKSKKAPGTEIKAKSEKAKPKSEKAPEKKPESKSKQMPEKKSESKSESLKEQAPKGSEAKEKDTKDVVKKEPKKPSPEVPVDPPKEKGKKGDEGESVVAPPALPTSSQPPPEEAASQPPPPPAAAPAETKDTIKPTEEVPPIPSKDDEVKALQSKLELLSNQLTESKSRQTMLAQALEAQKTSMEVSAQKTLDQALKESEAKHNRQLIDETNKIADSYNSMLREQLRLENESQVKSKRDALEDQAKKLNMKWSSELELRLSMQEGFYQTELARAFARLGGLHATVDGVLRAGQRTIRLQTLRNSCDTLSDTLDRIDSNSDVVDRYTIGTEVASLRKAAENDTFIGTVLDGIPTQAVAGNGIQSMGSLQERFAKVKRICRRVALVPETGGGMGTYTISYLQSLLTIRAWFPSSTTTTDLSEMHVYQLLHQADARLRRGDLEGAILYMNHLKGDARNVARDWLVDARLYLETRQAIQLVQTYMAASNVGPVLNTDNQIE